MILSQLGQRAMPHRPDPAHHLFMTCKQRTVQFFKDCNRADLMTDCSHRAQNGSSVTFYGKAMSLLVQPREGGAPWATLSRPLFPAVTTLFVPEALTVPLSHMGAPREPRWCPTAGALGEDGSPPAGVMTGLPDSQQEGEAGCLTVCSHTVKFHGGGLGTDSVQGLPAGP